MFPAKLFEYAAAGKPIVATMDFGAREFAIPSVAICQDAAAFGCELRRIREGTVCLTRTMVQECESIARRNTWDTRATQLLEFAGRASTSVVSAGHSSQLI